MPWAALYRAALAAGLGDDAFWRMSPAAVVAVTRGMGAGRGASRGRGRAQGAAGGAPMRAIGGLDACP